MMNTDEGGGITSAVALATKDIKYDGSDRDFNAYVAAVQSAYSRMGEPIPVDIRFYRSVYDIKLK